MAVSIETLRVEYASKVAAQAKADEAALLGAAKAMGELGTKAQATDEVLKRASQTHDRVVTKIDGVAAATKKLEAAERSHATQVAAVMDAYARGAPLEKTQQELARLAVVYDQATKKAIEHGQAVEARFTQAGAAVSTSLTTAGASTAKFTTTTNNASHAVRQLGIQSIDVFQQLASGAPIMTTFIQQGGQVAQVAAASGTSLGALAKEAAGALLRINPFALAIGVATLTIGGFAAASEVAARQQAALQNTIRATRGNYLALSEAAEAAARAVAGSTGVGAGEARTAAAQFAAQPNFAGGRAELETLLRVADDVAARLGLAFPEAAAKMAAGMGDATVLARVLEGQLTGFNAEMTRSIALQVSAGDAAGAYDRILRRVADTTKGAAEQSKTGLQRALQDLANEFTLSGSGATTFGDVMLRWGEHYVRYLQFLVTSTKDAASAIGRLLPGAAPSSANTLVNPASGASGLFQVVPDPGTRLRYGYNVDLPEQNIAAGLTDLLTKMRTANGNVDLALKNYGGFVTQDPSAYIASVHRADPGLLDRTVLPGGNQTVAQAIEYWGQVLGAGPDLIALAKRVAVVESGGRQFGGAVPASIPRDLPWRQSEQPFDVAANPTGVRNDPSAAIAAAVARATAAGGVTVTQEGAKADIGAYREALRLLAEQGETTGSQVNRLRDALSDASKTMVDAIPAADKLLREIEDQTGAAERMAQAYALGDAAVADAIARTRAEAEARQTVARGTAEHAALVEVLTEKYKRLGAAQGTIEIARQVSDIDKATEAQLRINAAYDGTVESLERVTAQEKAHAAALKSGIEPGMKEYDATVGKLSDSYIRGTRAAEDFRHIQSSVQAVTDILSTAFDRLGQGIVDAFLTGKGAAVSFSSIVRSVMGSVATSIAQLGVVNPILNSFGGTQRNSLWTGLGTLTSNAGVSASATGGLNVMNAASNASTFGGITDALGITDFGKQLSGIGDYLGLTGSNGLFGGVGNSITGILNTSLWSGPAGSLATTAGAEFGGAAGLAAGSPVTLGGLLGGAGLGFGAGSLAGGFLQSSLGKVGPAPTIGAGLGAAGGAALGSIIPGIGTVLGGLLGGLLGGGGGGLIGPKKATPFSATGLNATDGMLSVGQTFSQIVDVSQEVAALQQQTAQINSILAASNLRIANAVSSDNYGQSRIIGGNTGTWLNFGQGDGRPGSIADAFSELRFSSTEDTLNRALQGKAFANLEDLQATVARITTFVNDTAPALIALGKTETTYGVGSLAATITELSRQFDDAIAMARELGHEEDALTAARATAIATAQKSVNEVMDQSKMGFDLRYWQAKATNDNDPRLAFDASLVAFDVRAGQERAAFEAQLLGILGDAGKSSSLYIDQMAQLDRALYQERLTLLTQFNAQAVQADRSRAEQSALSVITSISDYAASLPFSDKSPMTGRAQYSLALGNFQSIAAGIGEGDFNALSQLPAAADQLLGSSRNLFGSGQQYATDFASVQAVLRGAVSQSPEDIVAAAIRASEAQQTAVLGRLIEKMVEKLDAILAETRLQAMRPAA